MNKPYIDPKWKVYKSTWASGRPTLISHLDGIFYDPETNQPFTGVLDDWETEGTISFWINGRWSRLDGPAYISQRTGKSYRIDGNSYTKEEYAKEIHRRRLASPEYFKNLL